MIRFFFTILIFSFFSSSAIALDKVTLPTSQEKLAKELFREIKCMVCQGQSIDDSNSELAKDMRDMIRTMIKDGKNKENIEQFLVERYGQHILFNPPINIATIFLWSGPFIILTIGILLFLRKLKDTRP